MTKAKWRSLGKHETRRCTGRCPRTAPFCPPPPALPGGPVGSAWCGARCRPLSTEARDSPRPRAPVEPGHSQRGEQEARWQRRTPLGDSAGGHHLSSALLVALCPASAEGCRAVLAGFQSACCPGLWAPHAAQPSPRPGPWAQRLPAEGRESSQGCLLAATLAASGEGSPCRLVTLSMASFGANTCTWMASSSPACPLAARGPGVRPRSLSPDTRSRRAGCPSV